MELCTVLEVAAIVCEVLSYQVELANAAIREACGLSDKIIDAAATLFATQFRYDAERASLAAALGYFQIRGVLSGRNYSRCVRIVHIVRPPNRYFGTAVVRLVQ